jgi:hypothetical protein
MVSTQTAHIPITQPLVAPACRAVLLEPPPTGAPARIMAIDPGGTTGIVVTSSKNWFVAEAGDLYDVWRILRAYAPRVILFERFDPQELPVDLNALDVRGVVRLHVLDQVPANYRPIIYWQPRDVKTLCSDRFLRENSLWVRGMGHGRDALRHLCWHLIKREGNTELLEWTKSGDSNGVDRT